MRQCLLFRKYVAELAPLAGIHRILKKSIYN